MKLSKILSGSVAKRTTIIVLVTTAAVLLTAGIWETQHVRDIVASEMDRQANRAMGSAVKVIDHRVACIETAVNTAASYADMFATHEMLGYELLKRLIQANQDIAAVTLLYKENYFSYHGRYFAPTITRSHSDGSLEEDEIGGPANDFCYLETDSNWIYTNKLDRGYWCLPYVDSMSTKRAMVTYSVPLHDKQNNIYAVLCADVDLYWVRDIVEEAKPYDYCDVIVMSRDSQYVCHPDERWVLSQNVIDYARKQNDKPFLSLADRMLRRERGNDTLELSQLDNDDNNKKKSERYIAFYAPIDRVLWSVSFLMPEKEILASANQLRTYMTLVLFLLLAIISAILYFVIRKQMNPLQKLADDTREIAKGNFNTPLPEVNSHDEIRHLRDSFANMQTSLARYIDQLQATTASKAAIENELHIASDIQKSMLPKIFPPYPDRRDIDIFGSLTSAKAVGGDLFDFFIRDNLLYFCIGDVSGKGVPASLVMAVTRSQFRTVSARESMPGRILVTINDIMAEGNDSNMFVTLFVGVLNLATGHLDYSNGGHESPIVVRSKGQAPFTLPCDSNLPVGVMPGWDFSNQEATLQPGESLFLYTDGLNEAENIDHGQFGEDRVFDMLQGLELPMSPKQIIETMRTAVSHFVGEAEQSDDLTMLALHFQPQDDNRDQEAGGASGV